MVKGTYSWSGGEYYKMTDPIDCDNLFTSLKQIIDTSY